MCMIKYCYVLLQNNDEKSMSKPRHFGEEEPTDSVVPL